ncbi:hypothetical protein D3C75_910520 [compost metagenome]
MDFHAVEACRNGVCRGLAEIVDDARQFVSLQRSRLGNVLEAIVDEYLGRGTKRGRGYRRRALLLQIHVGNTAHMPQLQENSPALGVYGIGHLAPSLYLRLRVNARGVLIALSLLRDLRGFGN